MGEPGFAPDALTLDAFLGGRLSLSQPRIGYRAGVDPVLLAASVAARPGQSVLDLGCGAGAALLCLGTRVPGLALTGVERQASYADLARANATGAGQTARIVTADLDALPAELRAERFDHVLANPPYFASGTRVSATDPGREAGLGEDTPLARWVEVAAKRCAPKGSVTMILRAERLAALMTAFAAHLGSLALLPLVPRAGRDARLVILRGIRAGRAPLRVAAPLCLHDGPRHETDGEDYARAVRGILRDAEPLIF